MNAKRIVHWSLLIVIALYVLTGFGITNYDEVSAITFGVFSKSLSITLHDYMIIPLVIFLAAHILLTMRPRLSR